jgi:hypothetical protein
MKGRWERTPAGLLSMDRIAMNIHGNPTTSTPCAT